MYLLHLPHLIHRYQSASAHHSVRCSSPSLLLSTKIHFSFSLDLSSSQSFHSSTKQWKLAAYCNKPYVNFCVIAENQCVPVRPFYTQITGLTHHCSCVPSYLFPRLNLANLPHPSFFLLVTPFSRPNSFFPKLSCHGRELFLHFKAVYLNEQRQ